MSISAIQYATQSELVDQSAVVLGIGEKFPSQRTGIDAIKKITFIVAHLLLKKFLLVFETDDPQICRYGEFSKGERGLVLATEKLHKPVNAGMVAAVDTPCFSRASDEAVDLKIAIVDLLHL